jgi:IS30 family transposase
LGLGLATEEVPLCRPPQVTEHLASKLILDWSPEQISGWLKTQYPDDKSLPVSHETIYRSLFIQARGVLKKERMDHLRSKRRMRRSHSGIFRDSRGQIVDAISIRERPADVDERAIPGHWEGDLLSGAKNSYSATHHAAELLQIADDWRW